jgi:hypothetical protein
MLHKAMEFSTYVQVPVGKYYNLPNLLYIVCVNCIVSVIMEYLANLESKMFKVLSDIASNISVLKLRYRKLMNASFICFSTLVLLYLMYSGWLT